MTLNNLKPVAALCVVMALPGCSYLAPGMQMLIPNQAVSVSASQENSTPLQVDLLPITPDLLASQVDQQQVAQLPAELLSEPAPYRLGPGDVLSVAIYEHPEFSAAAQGVTGANASIVGYVVNAQGNLQFPLVGDIPVSGLEVSQVGTMLNQRLARFIQNPQATVRVIDYRSQKVMVDGEVRTPGLVPVSDVPLTIVEAMGRAGGALPTADQSRLVLYRAGKRYDLNVPALMASGQPVHKVTLQEADLLRVPSAKEQQVYVIGEVPRPAAVPMRYDGLRLSEALGEALGVSGTTGNARQIYVVRNVALDRAEVYHLSAKSPVALAMADNFRLQSRDVIYVDSTALVRFNRVISLILPSAQGLRLGQNIQNNQ